MGLFADGFKELKKASVPLYKTPKSIQETIEIMKVAENGIFEVSRNHFSKCYRFRDINYTTTNEEEQIDIFERYCKFLNSLDCNFKITVNNKNKDMQNLREEILLQYQYDEFDKFRRIYNEIIEDKIREGRQGIEQERYLTLTIEQKNFEEAKAQFATLEATIHKAFGELGTDIVALSGNERIKVLHDFYHLGEEEGFSFDLKHARKVGADFRNDLCNGMLKYFPDHIEDEGKYIRAMFIKKYPSSRSDRFITSNRLRMTGILSYTDTWSFTMTSFSSLSPRKVKVISLPVAASLLSAQRLRAHFISSLIGLISKSSTKKDSGMVVMFSIHLSSM